jgi:hypothetical protein
MATNDPYLLNQLLLESQNKIAPELSESEFFELYVAELLLKNYGLSYEEIENGVIGGGNDGGVDAIYGFVDDELIVADSDFSDAKNIELIIIQAKRSPGYKEGLINSLISTFHDLLDWEKDLDHFASSYNSDLIEFFRDFRSVHRSLATKFPKLKFSFNYVTKGNSSEVHANVIKRTETLKEQIAGRFSEFEFSFDFYGARDLLNLARKQSTPALTIKVAETLSPDDGGYVCLVALQDYFEFITDESGKRRQMIFDANVREYEGLVEVNKGIRNTLESENKNINFWWLNNGITIVATKASLSGKILALEDAKVVNGLQTSQLIFRHFSSTDGIKDDRLILIRVIETENEEVRNDIIKATNSQSRIPAYSLRATEPIHHDIEQDFLHNGLYYDRQKNYYKNQGLPKNRIVSIQHLAQAVGAIVLQRPNDSRGRPTSLIKSDELYEQVFSTNYPIGLYLKCARLMRLVDNHLRSSVPDYVANEKRNLRFAMAMFIACLLVKSPNMTAVLFAEVSLDELDDELLSKSTNQIWEAYEAQKTLKSLDGDLIAKNKDFDLVVLNKVKAILNGEQDL